MKPAPFTMLRPRTVDEAVRQLAEVGDSGKVLAGGQSLIPLMNLRLARADVIIDIGGIESMRNISLDENDERFLHIGGGTRHEEIARSTLVIQEMPILAKAAALIGHTAIRTRGTIGGSLAHSDPLAEYAMVLLALEARVNARSVRGVRSIPFQQFLNSVFTTTLEDDEIITDVEVPVRQPQHSWGICEHSRRPGDFAVAAAAALVNIADGRVTTATVATIGHPNGPLRHDDATRVLIGQPLDAKHIHECADSISRQCPIISDSAYSDSARRRILMTVISKALEDAQLRCSTGKGLE